MTIPKERSRVVRGAGPLRAEKRRFGMQKAPLVSYLMILPIVALLILIYYPTLLTLVYSFTKMDLLDPSESGFAGLSNYRAIFADPVIMQSFLNSGVVLVVVLALTVIIGLGFAFVLKQASPVSGMLLAITIIPWALPPIVSGIIWRWVFHPSFGFANSILIRLHVIEAPIQWLNSPTLLIGIVAVSVAWRAIPLAALIFFSALQNIPQQLYDAAAIDGANVVGRFLHITLPLLRTAMGIVLTTTSITAISVFDEVVSLAGYSSANSTLLMQTYLRTFRNLDFGTGSALVYVVMLLTGMVGLFYVRRIYKEVEYS